MKTIALCFAISGALLFTSCDSSTEATGGTTGTTTTETAAEAPKMTVNEADWVEKDLSTVAKMAQVTMKVPADAKLSENGNGQVEILLNDYYLITVGATAISSAQEGINDQLSLAETSYKDIKKLVEEPNGMVYSKQMKDEANGTTYQPEVHFCYYLERDGAFFSIESGRSLDAYSTPGSAYSEETAKKIYEIVKSSARINE